MTAMSAVFTQSLKKSKKRQMKDANHVVRILEVFTKHKIQDRVLVAEIIEFLKGRIRGMD